VNVRCYGCRIVERTGANETDLARGLLAEDCYLTGRATPNLLLFAAAARDGDRLRLAREKPHPVGFDQQVGDERAPGLPLTVQTMTAMDEQRSGHNPVANGAARAAALKWSAHSHLQQGWSPDCTSGPAHESIGVVRWIAGVVGLGGSAT
jgi:hypothetical protein